jgi:catalase
MSFELSDASVHELSVLMEECMPGEKLFRSRRDLLTSAGQLSIGTALVPVLGSAALSTSAKAAPARSTEDVSEDTAQKVVDALEGAYGRHRGQRRNHTKGVGARGTFVGNPEAAVYSRSALFSGESLEVIARFSIAGGDPEVSDTDKSPRGLALEFRLPNGALHHITMIHTPMFFAAVPQTFLDKFIALAIDPVTGKPDPAKLREFEASHPDNASQAKFLKENNPPPSYAESAYYGIHTFRFVNKDGKITNVRFRFVPQAGEKQLSDAEVKSFPRDFLQKELIERLAKGPARWDMILTIGEPGDAETDPTVLWPKNRRELRAGTLTITSATPEMEAGSYKINYDPLQMADGIQPSDDPVLLFRSPSYATSHTRRQRDL